MLKHNLINFSNNLDFSPSKLLTLLCMCIFQLEKKNGKASTFFTFVSDTLYGHKTLLHACCFINLGPFPYNHIIIAIWIYLWCQLETSPSIVPSISCRPKNLYKKSSWRRKWTIKPTQTWGIIRSTWRKRQTRLPW